MALQKLLSRALSNRYCCLYCIRTLTQTLSYFPSTAEPKNPGFYPYIHSFRHYKRRTGICSGNPYCVVHTKDLRLAAVRHHQNMQFRYGPTCCCLHTKAFIFLTVAQSKSVSDAKFKLLPPSVWGTSEPTAARPHWSAAHQIHPGTPGWGTACLQETGARNATCHNGWQTKTTGQGNMHVKDSPDRTREMQRMAKRAHSSLKRRESCGLRVHFQFGHQPCK